MTELLAPAGSYQAMTAAFAAGADAVYIGGEKFGARAYADNLNCEQMKEAIYYAHVHDKKLYLTVNTMLKEAEISDELYEYLLPFYECGLDAVIVQDLGVFSFVKNCFPDLAIHCSTQMTITGWESAKMLEQMGASRVVTARELSLDEIRKIREHIHIEIESFVHGALCYCYSGQCLMSSMIGGRSGNRGKCAQPCRLPYQVLEHGNRINDDKSQYPLSPKDMCTIDLLPEILKAGVTSLKIEGRMKRPEYAAGVVEVYRKYLDQILQGEWKGVSREDHQKLFDLYNRDGFHQGYYKQRNGKNMMALFNEKASGKPKKESRNEALFTELTDKYVNITDRVPVNMKMRLLKNSPAFLEIEGCAQIACVEGELVQEAKNQPLQRERIEKQMRKTGGTLYHVGRMSLLSDPDIFIPMQQLNELRRRGLAELENKIRASHVRENAKYRYRVPEEPCDSVKPYLSASAETEQQAAALILIPEVQRIYVFWKALNPLYVNTCHEAGKEIYLMLPYMVRDTEKNFLLQMLEEADAMGIDGFLVHNPEQYALIRRYGWERRTVLNTSLSPWNCAGHDTFAALGMEGDTVPFELNLAEIRRRSNQNSELVVYGHSILMVTAQCMKKNLDRCQKQNSILHLRDRYQKEFPVKCDCRYCYNTIYNCVPISLNKEMTEIKKLPVRGFRMNFTVEDQSTVTARVAEFLAAYHGDVTFGGSTYASTKGHFRRGV